MFHIKRGFYFFYFLTIEQLTAVCCAVFMWYSLDCFSLNIAVVNAKIIFQGASRSVLTSDCACV